MNLVMKIFLAIEELLILTSGVFFSPGSLLFEHDDFFASCKFIYRRLDQIIQIFIIIFSIN